MTTICEQIAEAHARLQVAAYFIWERLGRPEGPDWADLCWRQAQLSAFMPPHPIVFEVEKGDGCGKG
jgi:hypothetical protein